MNHHVLQCTVDVFLVCSVGFFFLVSFAVLWKLYPWVQEVTMGGVFGPINLLEYGGFYAVSNAMQLLIEQSLMDTDTAVAFLAYARVKRGPAPRDWVRPQARSFFNALYFHAPQFVQPSFFRLGDLLWIDYRTALPYDKWDLQDLRAWPVVPCGYFVAAQRVGDVLSRGFHKLLPPSNDFTNQMKHGFPPEGMCQWLHVRCSV